MGAPGKWFKAFMGFRKPDKPDAEKNGGRGKKWRLLRSSSGDMSSSWKSFKSNHRAASEGFASSPASDPFANAVATVLRAPPKDFRAVKMEWGAIRIQSAFRRFLARRALRALKGVVKLQALVRGRQVRKQAAATLKCMQALVRVQARVRAHRVRMSSEGQTVSKVLNQRYVKPDVWKNAEAGWCRSKGTLADIQAKLQTRQQGAFKRERAIAYSSAQKKWRSSSNSETPMHKCGSVVENQEFGKNNWSWLERWMAAKPWETRLMEPPCFGSHGSSAQSKSSDQSLVKVRKNMMSTRVSVRPPCFDWSPSSEPCCDQSPVPDTICASATSGNTCFASDKTESNGRSKPRPNYMNMTESTMAKRRTPARLSLRVQRQSSMDELQFLKRSADFADHTHVIRNGTSSVNLSRANPLCMPSRLEKWS